MRGLVGLVQWLSTAFVIVMIISWVAVGHPGTTTSFLWAAQEIFASGAQSFADYDADLSLDTDAQMREERRKSDEYEAEISTFKPRPLGTFDSPFGW